MHELAQYHHKVTIPPLHRSGSHPRGMSRLGNSPPHSNSSCHLRGSDSFSSLSSSQHPSCSQTPIHAHSPFAFSSNLSTSPCPQVCLLSKVTRKRDSPSRLSGPAPPQTAAPLPFLFPTLSTPLCQPLVPLLISPRILPLLTH